MSKISKIQDKYKTYMAERELQKEAKNLTKKELEEFYQEVTLYEKNMTEEEGNNKIGIFILAFLLICVVGGTIINSMEYEDTEYENYKTFGKAICDEKDSNYKYFTINADTIEITCENGLHIYQKLEN